MVRTILNNKENTKNKPAVVFAAGATGGHIFPAIAIASKLKNSEVDKILIGSGSEVEKKILKSNTDIKHLTIASTAIRGKGIVGILKFLFILPKSLFESINYYRANNVKCVLGFGGYPSVIPVLAARILGLPVIIQEQNAYPGFANKFLSFFAKHTFCVPGAKGLKDPKTEVMNPVREEFEDVAKSAESKKIRLLVMGGSQGAQSLNTIIAELADFLDEKEFNLIHQCGQKDFKRIEEIYKEKKLDVELVSFIQNLPEVFEKVDLIISRAGAMSISEISASGRAAIYVPLNIAGGHQIENTASLVKIGAAKVVKQDKNLKNNLEKELLSITKEEINKMSLKAKQYYFKGEKSSADIIANKIKEFL